jgi:prophage antirepressor-like protein
MDALIDLETSREYMTVTLNGNDHIIKLAGTVDDPYFCGKDVCTVLGYTNIKNALFNNVDEYEKKELSQLVDRESNGPLAPKCGVLAPSTAHLGAKGPLSFRDKQAVYINEPGLYSLIMASKAPFAKDFKKMVCSVILPTIRKHGSYVTEKRLTENMNHRLAIKDSELAREKKQLAIKDSELAIKDSELAAKEVELALEKSKRKEAELAAKAKISRTLKYNKAATAVEPREYIYIATTDLYSTENMFKVGGCASFELLKSRLSSYNSGKSDSDAHYFSYVRKTVSYRAVEHALQSCASGFRENANREMYLMNYNLLVECLDYIVDNNGDFLDFVNSNRERMVVDTINTTPVKTVPIRLEKIRPAGPIEEEVYLTSVFGQESVAAVKESLETFEPEDNTVKRAVFEHRLRLAHPEVEIVNRKRPLWEFVKYFGGLVNPAWRYRY